MPSTPYIKGNSLTEKGQIYPFIPSFWLDERVFKQATITSFYFDLISFIFGELNTLAIDGINTLFPNECRDTIKLTTYPLFVSQQDIQQQQKAVYRFDKTNTFEDHLSFSADTNQYILPLPPGVLNIDLLTDNPVSPTILWVSGQDFLIETHNQRIILETNTPLEEQCQKTPLGEYILWARGITLKTNLLSNTWGSLLPLNTFESRYYDLTDIYHTVLKVITEGPSTYRLNKLLSLCFGFPILEPEEQILELAQDGKTLITTQKLISIPSTASIRTNATQPGDPLTTACTIFQAKDDLPSTAELPYIIISQKFLPAYITTPLIFPNTVVKTYQLTNPNRVRPLIPEQQAPFDQFFSRLEQACLDNGQQPNILFNQRLPTQINPARWIAKTLLPANSTIIHLDITKCQHKPIPCRIDQALDKLIHPGKLISIQIELTIQGHVVLTDHCTSTLNAYAYHTGDTGIITL